MAPGWYAAASIVALASTLLFGCSGGSPRAPAQAQQDEAPRRGEQGETNVEVRDTETPRPSPQLKPPAEHVDPPAPEYLDLKLLPSHPEGAIDITPRRPNRCIAQLELSAEVVGSEVTLRATLASNSDEPVKMTVRSPCPGGPVSFSGLGEGFDYYGTCNAGACQESDNSLTVSLPAGRRKVEIASTSFSLSGDTCRPRLPGGTHEIYGHAAVLSPEGATICGSAFAKLTVPVTEKKRTTPAPVSCLPQPICGLACPSGRFARDENGCSLCACDDEFPGTL